MTNETRSSAKPTATENLRCVILKRSTLVMNVTRHGLYVRWLRKSVHSAQCSASIVKHRQHTAPQVKSSAPALLLLPGSWSIASHQHRHQSPSRCKQKASHLPVWQSQHAHPVLVPAERDLAHALRHIPHFSSPIPAPADQLRREREREGERERGQGFMT